MCHRVRPKRVGGSPIETGYTGRCSERKAWDGTAARAFNPDQSLTVDGQHQGSRPLLDKVGVESAQVDRAVVRVYEGMRVYDRSGRKLGTVEAVYLSELAEPDEAEAQGPTATSVGEPGEFSLIEDFARALTERVSDPWRGRLLRHGFIRIGSLSPFAADRYAMPDQIDHVSDDRVMLGVKGDELIKA
jgi:hypothetical protein